jgi:hypothetical protein
MNDKQLLKETLQNMLRKVGPENLVSSSEPIKRKIQKGLIYPTISEGVFYQVQNDVLMENLMESVFDPIQTTRSPELWGEDEVMRPEAKAQIFKVIEDWKEQMNVPFTITKMTMIGSMTGFQYNKNSDIDINVWTDLSDGKGIWTLRKNLPSGNYLEGTHHEIALWAGEAGENAAVDMKRFENVYNLLTDEWEKKTEKNDIKVPYPYVMELSKFFMNSFDLTLSQADRDISETKVFLDYNPDRQDITLKEKVKLITDKLVDLRADMDSLKMGKHILRSFMVEGYEDMPFKVSINYQHEDPRFSMNSMVYKMCDTFGYIEKVSSKAKELGIFVKEVEELLSQMADERVVGDQ